MIDESKMSPVLRDILAVLRDLRDSVEIARASLNGVPTLVALLRQDIENAARTEDELLKLVSALDPELAQELRIQPVPGAVKPGCTPLQWKLARLPEVRAMCRRLGTSWSGDRVSDAPPVRLENL